MHIFIDESGNFAPVLQGHSVSLVAALVFSDAGLATFEKDYGLLRRRLPKEKGEVKGRLLSEAQIRKVTRLLRKSGCLLEVIATDAAFQTTKEVQFHKAIQAEKLIENITDEHHPNIHSAVGDLKARLEALAPQLYLQSLAMSELIYSVLYHADIYFAFREPRELGEYHWTMDAKGRDGLTNWEDWWSQIIMPVTQSKTMREPLARVKEGDFSFHDQFKTEPDEYLLQFMDNADIGEFFDLRPVLSSDFRFSSAAEPGLEAADIIANATRRALGGNLKEFGWSEIPNLMIHRSGHYIRLMTVASDEIAHPKLPYADVIDGFRSGGRSMFPAE